MEEESRVARLKRRRRQSRRRLYNILIVLLVGVFLFSGTRVIVLLKEYERGEELQSAAEEIVLANTATETPAAEETPATETETAVSEGAEPGVAPGAVVHDSTSVWLNLMNLEALQEVNSDVCGWVYIPDTVVSYPILLGEDNSEYLYTAYNGESISSGSIFMDYRCSKDLSDFNTVIYGHNMRNGSMFASLNEYQNQEYYEANKSVYITLNGGTYRCEIFSAYVVDRVGTAYTLDFADDAAKQTFLDEICAASEIEGSILPSVSDRILTLSTCTSSSRTNRMVVHARIADFTMR